MPSVEEWIALYQKRADYNVRLRDRYMREARIWRRIWCRPMVQFCISMARLCNHNAVNYRMIANRNRRFWSWVRGTRP